MIDPLVKKRKEFEMRSKDIDLGSNASPKRISRFSCPCCGYPTLLERAGYEICVLCFWEDDGQDDDDAAEVWGGPNGRYSLESARANFVEYRTMYHPDNNTTLSGADSEACEKLKKTLVGVFERTLSASDAELTELWRQALILEEAISMERKADVDAYLRSIRE